jgi:predicted nucleotidyltransferase component of viral defense system
LIDGAKVTFHSRNESDRPKQQIDFLKSTPKLSVSQDGFNILGVDGLFVMKSVVIYDRMKSRDLYDLMVLTRDHGYSIEQIFAAINAYQPLRNKDPEQFKSVVTGIIPLDKNDEGFSSIHLNVKITDIYKYFRKLIDDYEVNLVKSIHRQLN